MPKIYKYNAKFRLPDDKYIELKDLKSKELLDELNKLLEKNYFWNNKLNRDYLYNVRTNIKAGKIKRHIHPILQKVITIELIN